MYEQMGDHLQAEFTRIQLALQIIAERSAGEGTGADGEPLPSVGRHDTPGEGLSRVGETVRSLAGTGDEQSGEDSSQSELQRRLDRHAATIESELKESRGTGVELRFDRLCRTYDLSRTERDALLIALAPAFDRNIYKLYGQIQNSPEPELPTVDFLELILIQMGHGSAADEGNSSPSEALSPRGSLFKHKLLERHPTNPSYPAAHDAVVVDERIVQYLKGDDSLDPKLGGIASIDQPTSSLSALTFDEETTDALETIEARSSATEQPTIFFVSGEDGTGKDRLPAALSDATILRAEAEDVFQSQDRLMRFLREGTLRNATIHLEAVDDVTDEEEGQSIDMDQDESGVSIESDAETLSVDDIVEQLDDAPGDVFLSHTDSWTPDVDLETHRLETCECPFPDQDVRKQIWAEYADEFADPDLVSHIATNFRLPQRDIRRAIRTARYLCRTGADIDEVEEQILPAHDTEADVFAPVDGDLTREHLYEACKRYSASNLDRLAEQLDPGYTWDDIALNHRQESHLRELCGHLQYRGAVTNEWGFGEPGSRGDGIVALFYGQPGTGKTMAAEIIANETGLDLYRVDLSQIINKYIGETESRLATLLDEAERSNAILLFDEADSIFGKRAEVKDATDRYANTEINFLLQRLESFDGILLLTTNKRSGIDSAFKRRIQHSIGFEKPQELIRRNFWKEVFPEEANVATDEFDYEFLGRITTTPALIRKVAKYAAYIAATEAHDGRPLDSGEADLSNVTIEFDHVLRALQYAREAGGAGFQVHYGEYEDRLREYDSHGVERDWEDELERFQGDGEWDEKPTTVSATSDSESRPTTPGKQSADQVDPGDGRSPEDVIREFFSRLADADDSAHDLYHSEGLAEEFTHRNLRLMKHGDLSIEGEITRLRNDHDRVILEFDQQLEGSHVPDAIDGKPLPVRYELRPEPAGWRIFDITRKEEAKRPQ